MCKHRLSIRIIIFLSIYLFVLTSCSAWPSSPLASSTPTQISPGRLAFVSYQNGYSSLRLINIDGSGLTRLAQDMAVILNPVSSPDGKKLAFQACIEGSTECTSSMDIFIANTDGSGLFNLTDNLGEDWDPAWSPDGEQIAFSSDRAGNQEIYLINSDGTGLARMTDTPVYETNPQWSPDGERIVFERGNEGIRLMNANGSEQRLLVAEGANPRWAPDGTQIAFTCSTGSHLEICTIHPDGTSLRNVTNSPADEFGFSWSPDGKMIAFVTNRDGNPEIYVWCGACGDSSTSINITKGPANDQDPIWSPDGSRIAYLSDDALCVMNSDGSNKIKLATHVTGAPVWLP